MQDTLAVVDALTVNSGGVTTLGGPVSTQVQYGGQSALATIATSGTITTSGVRVIRTTVGGAVTSCVLQAGTLAGQEITVINENTTGSNTIGFAASGTSNYASPAAISGLTAAKFVWDGGTSLWYRTS